MTDVAIRTPAFTPALVTDVELTAPADLPAEGRGRAWVVVRDHGLPVGMLTLDLPASAAEVVAAFAGQRVADPAALHAARERARRDGASVTAVVCTRERPDALRRCLASLAAQDYPRAGILVVDNAPTGDATRRVVDEFPAVRYVTASCSTCDPTPR